MNAETKNELCEESYAKSYAKLEKLKEIRDKTIQIEKVKNSMKDTLNDVEIEKKALLEYKEEISQLLQEKMAHVEELRLIHTDINTMESLIKQSCTDRKSMLTSAKRLFEQYKPLKIEIDVLRQELGLEKSSEFCEEEPELSAELHSSSPSSNTDGNLNRTNIEDNTSPEKMTPQPSLMFGIEASENNPVSIPSCNGKINSQPPPMKSCQSCHQQIHRNAPICPLCKAKSRSRNPKKPKKIFKEK